MHPVYHTRITRQRFALVHSSEQIHSKELNSHWNNVLSGLHKLHNSCTCPRQIAISKQMKRPMGGSYPSSNKTRAEMKATITVTMRSIQFAAVIWWHSLACSATLHLLN